jgi:hypothetical protein
MADDVRSRRAERVRQERMKSLGSQYKYYIIAGVAILAIIGLVAAFPGILPKGAAPQKFVHEHPTYAIFIHGEHVSFNDVAYDQRNINDKVHLHTTSGSPAKAATWHVEGLFPGGVPTWGLGRIFEQYQVTFRQGYLKLDSLDGHNGTAWPDEGSNVWQVWSSKVVVNATTGENERQPWTQVTGDYATHVPRDLEKILITYGTLTPEEVTRQQGLVPEPSP